VRRREFISLLGGAAAKTCGQCGRVEVLPAAQYAEHPALHLPCPRLHTYFPVKCAVLRYT